MMLIHRTVLFAEGDEKEICPFCTVVSRTMAEEDYPRGRRIMLEGNFMFILYLFIIKCATYKLAIYKFLDTAS